MLSTPIPRRSFLDSRLRSQSLENRRLAWGRRTEASHLGLGHRVAPSAPNRVRHSTPAGRPSTGTV